MAKDKEKKQIDLTRCDLPGGARAHFFKPAELSARRQRKLAAYDIALMPKLRQLMIAQKIIGPDGEKLAESAGLPGMPVGLSVAESEDLIAMNDTAAWAYLKSWSLMRDGSVWRLPEDVDDLLDNYPGDVIDALVAHAAKIVSAQATSSIETQFDLSDEAVEDEDSPTGGSGD